MADTSKRTKDSLGKEMVGDKLGKNGPKRKVRSGTGIVTPQKSGLGRSTFKRTRIRTVKGN